MPAKKSLGRGLGAIVSLQPVQDGGSARIDEAIRASPGRSVLALSGESFEEMARATAANPPRHTRNGIAEPVAVSAFVPTPPPEEVQYSLFDPDVVDATVNDGAVAEVPEPEPAPPVPPPPEPAAAVVPQPLLDDDLLFLDEQIGGIVLPEVELE